MVISRDLQENVVAKVESKFYEVVLSKNVNADSSQFVKSLEGIIIEIHHAILSYNLDDELLFKLFNTLNFCQNYLYQFYEDLLYVEQMKPLHKLSA